MTDPAKVTGIGAKRRVVFKGARIFFPEERSQQFNQELRSFWA
jgi:hypothetical protein